jgi:hypothetical protein
MNIFYLHKDPVKAASAMINKHVVKMVLESAQLLCTCHRVVDGTHYIDTSSGRKLQKWSHPDSFMDEHLYKSQHFNHPCSLWLRESVENYNWLYQHFIALGNEYKRRYNKEHASIVKLSEILKTPPKNLPQVPFTEPAQAILPQYKKEGNSIAAYHDYYISEKIGLGTNEDRERFFKFLEDEFQINPYE